MTRDELERRAMQIAKTMSKEGLKISTVILCPFHSPEGPLAIVGEDNEDVICLHDLPTCKEYQDLDIPDYLRAIRIRIAD